MRQGIRRSIRSVSYTHLDVYKRQIEILPGLMPKVIRRVARLVKLPVIAGGLISEKEDVMAALSAGAISVSSTNQSVWSV